MCREICYHPCRFVEQSQNNRVVAVVERRLRRRKVGMLNGGIAMPNARLDPFLTSPL
jgi:hypothetical protein